MNILLNFQSNHMSYINLSSIIWDVHRSNFIKAATGSRCGQTQKNESPNHFKWQKVTCY